MLTPTSGTLADYNTAILDGNPTYIKIEFPVQNVTLLDSDIAIDGGVTISSIMNTDTDLTIGKAVSSELVCSFLNGSKFTGFDWTEECKVSLGVDISGTTNWVTVGYFKGQKPDRTVRTDVIQFIAYDRMQTFDVLADDFLATVTYPTTLADIYHDMCTFLGVGYTAGNEIADSLTLSYDESPFGEGYTCRAILAQIAEACGCYAKIDNTGNVKMVWFTDHTSDYSLTGDEYFHINLAESATSTITHIRVACTFDADVNPILYPATNPVEVYQIIDNPFLLNITSADLTTVLTAILSRFTAIGGYIPAYLDAIGNWMVEPGDIIEVGYDTTQTMNMPVFSSKLEWNGACGSAYECTGSTERAVMSESVKEQYEANSKVLNKYTIRSGVDIDNDGVTISGGKFLKLISGGVLDVQAQNFVVNSTNKVFEAGLFKADEDGVHIDDDAQVLPSRLHMINYNANIPTGEDGSFDVYIKSDVGNFVVMLYSWNGVYSKIRRINFNGVNDAGRDTIKIFSSANDIDLGDSANPIYQIYSKYYYGNGVANNLTETAAGKVLDARQGKVLNDFRYRSLTGSSVNLDSYYGLEKAGLYYVGTGVVNSPSAYSGLLVISGSNASYQICVSADNHLFFRKRVGSPPVWSAWVDLGTKTTGTITKNASAIDNSNFHLDTEVISGTMLLVSGYFRVTTAIANNTKIATVSIKPKTQVFASVVSSNGKLGRFMLNTDGEIINEIALEANSGYYSMTFVSNYV